MKRKRMIYVAGPMTGLPKLNYPKFRRVTARLRRQGWDVVSPVEIGETMGLRGDSPDKQDAALLRHVIDAELRALHAPGDVHLAVDAMLGHCFVDEMEETHGEHGFSLDCPQARTLLWLSGPGIPAGLSIPEADIVDVAPTLARLLSLSLPQAQGKAIEAVIPRA